MIPLLLSVSGPGANSRFAISFVLGIGMAIGTIFTLFVVPTLYTVVASERHASARKTVQSRSDAWPSQPAESH